MSTYYQIAHKNDELFTVWGPCFCVQEPDGTVIEKCAACQHAEKLEAAGLDYEEEYQKWKRGARE